MVDVGRASSLLSGQLRRIIESGKVGRGDFLPTVRELSDRHGVAPRTVQRALKVLEREGLVASEPRQGYRVTAAPGWARREGALAYVLSTEADPAAWDPLHQALVLAFQRAAGSRGWPLWAVSSGGRPQAQILGQMESAKLNGLILDTVDPELLALVRQTRLPAIMVDAWREDAGLDVVIQDNFLGGLLAAEYLLQRGRTRLGWLGPVGASGHSIERYGGAVAGLARAGTGLHTERRIETNDPAKIEEIWLANAREMLAGPNRPTGVLALWNGAALALSKAAAEGGLVLGKDLDLVSWTPEELYESHYVKLFHDSPVPPAIVWSVRTMAEEAVERMTQRRQDLQRPPLRLKVPVKLVQIA